MRHDAPLFPCGYIKVVCRDWPSSYAPPGVLRASDGKILGLFLFYDPAKDAQRRETLRGALSVADALAMSHGRHAFVSEWSDTAKSCDLVRSVLPDRAYAA